LRIGCRFENLKKDIVLRIGHRFENLKKDIVLRIGHRFENLKKDIDSNTLMYALTLSKKLVRSENLERTLI
jgi:hypothetical protein